MLEASLSAAVSTASELAVDQGCFAVSTVRTRHEQQAPGYLLSRFRFQRQCGLLGSIGDLLEAAEPGSRYR